MKNLLVSTAVLSALLASPALAQSTHQRMRAAPQANNTYVGSAPVAYAYDSATVVSANQILGRDPDPNIRLSLIHEGNVSDN